MKKDSFLTKLRYSLFPRVVDSKRGILIRKRMFHKEFVILILIEIDNTKYYEEIGKVDCLTEAIIFINDIYNINIKL